MTRTRIVWVGVLFALVCAAFASATLIARAPLPSSTSLLSPSAIDSARQPAANITWSTNSLDVVFSPGETASRSLTLTSNRNVGGLQLCVSSALTPFVTIEVSKKRDKNDNEQNDAEDRGDDRPRKNGCAADQFELKANKPQSVDLTFSIPAGTALGTYEGTIEIRRGKQTLPQTLKVTVNVWHKYSDVGAPITFAYPDIPGLTSRITLHPNRSVSLDILIGSGDFVPVFYASFDEITTSSPRDWFLQNVDSSGELLISTYTQTDLQDGRSVLLLTGGIPIDWDSGPLTHAYIFSPDLSKVVGIQISQDNPLDRDATSLVNNIITTIQFH